MEEGLSKRESAFLKGLALWMMIYHHRFIDSMIWTYDLEFQKQFVFLLDEEFTRIVAWFCKIALSLMTFVSGYGICFVFNKSKNNKPSSALKNHCKQNKPSSALKNHCKQNNPLSVLKNDYKQVFKRYKPFYFRYWYAFLVWTLIEILINNVHFQTKEYILNGLGLSYSLNGSWWYVLQYVEMMALAPLLDLFLTKFSKKTEFIKWLTAIVIMGVGVLIPGFRHALIHILEISKFQVSYMAIFVVGYGIARWNIYGRIRTYLAKIHPFIRIIICLAGLIAIMAVRIKLSTFAAYCRTDFIIATIWILFLCELLKFLPFVVDFFGWFSKYSMYIWVLHLIFFDKFFYPLSLISGYAIGNYLIVVALTTLAAVVLERIEFYVMGVFKNLFNRGKKNGKEKI